MRKFLSALLLALVMVVLPVYPQAQEPPLVADLSDTLVAITAGFTGKRVVLYGVVDNTDGVGDVAVVVRGPEHSPVVRRKEQIAGIWLNRHDLTFAEVPSFYAIATSRPVQDLADHALLRKHGIGLASLEFATMGEDPGLPEHEFRQGLFRIKQNAGLYPEKPGEVRFMPKGLFKAEFNFPSNVTTGLYQVDVYFFRNGTLVDQSRTPLSINKIGFSAQVYEFAMLEPFAYAVLALFLAVLSGWFVSAVFRREG